MSENRLRKFIQSEYCTVRNNLTFTPVLLSDSKGKYLKRASSTKKQNLKFYCKSGKDSSDILKWCKNNVHKLIHEFHRVHIYLWIGTCDFTKKDGHYICKNENNPLRKIKENLCEIKDRFVSDNVRITFLHVPYYSISIWNKQKGHQNPDQFKNDDFELNELVDSVNSYIDGLNEELGTSASPKFNLDIVRSRKPKDAKQRYSLNFGLLPDGIHPGQLLSKAWLISLIRRMNTDCD